MPGAHTASDRGVHRSRPKLVSANGVDLCVQTFGEAGDPAILLIGGAESSMDWWEDGFCELLASGRRFVIRYDLRDTGQSVSYEPGAPGYDGSDLVADAVGLLDALGSPVRMSSVSPWVAESASTWRSSTPVESPR